MAGTVLALNMGYTHLCLPMEFEVERRCSTEIGFVDPRTSAGDLLDPVRFPRNVIENLKHDTTAYAYAGQYQQRPSPREGNMFKRGWFVDKFVDQPPPNCRWVRHWDLAASKRSSSARTAGVKIGQSKDGRFYVASVVKVQEQGAMVRQIIMATAQADGRATQISLPQDPGQASKVQAQDMVAMLAGFVVSAEPETGDKETRAQPFAAQCQAGNAYIVRGDLKVSYLDELCSFPTAKVQGSGRRFVRRLRAAGAQAFGGCPRFRNVLRTHDRRSDQAQRTGRAVLGLRRSQARLGCCRRHHGRRGASGGRNALALGAIAPPATPDNTQRAGNKQH